jgi:hypothetical protein
MEKTGAERKVAHKAANGRKAAIHRITSKGRQMLTAGVDASRGPAEPLPAESTTVAGIHPGEPQSRPTGNPLDRSGPSSPNPPVQGASTTTGESPAVTSHAAGGSARPHEALSLLPEPDPESWAA